MKNWDRFSKDEWQEECGVFGVFNHIDASHLTYMGLYAQQHRGQESAGIVSNCDGEHIHHKGMGLVAEVFTPAILQKLKGHSAIGHVRYSTTGINQLTNAQPLTAQLLNGPVAMAHNGNIVNSQILRTQLKAQGAIFQGTNDTECLLHLLARHPSKSMIRALQDCLEKMEGAFSLVILTDRKLIAARDPYGFRPLVLGVLQNEYGETSYVIASETCAFDLIGARFEREIQPGEIFWVDAKGTHSVQFSDAKERRARCVFEYIYFARPDSYVFGQSVYDVRKRLGRELAKQEKIVADLVVPVPDSGVAAAIGYAAESGLPFEMGIIRNHYVGRTFIQPIQASRSFGVRIKLNPQSAVLAGKRVIVVDDSLVRGTTSQKIVRLIRQAGAAEVHLRIAAPPTTGPCYYGVDTPQKKELIASQQEVSDIRKYVEADTLEYLSMDGLWRAVHGDDSSYCAACFDCRYPTQLFEAGG